MNITFAQIGASGSAVATFPTNVVSGSLLVLVLENRQNTQGTLSVSDNINGAWTLGGNTSLSSGVECYLYYFNSSGAGVTTITVSLSGGSSRLALTYIAREYPGTLLGGGSVFQAFQGAVSASSSVSTASITTTYSNQLLVSFGFSATSSAGYSAVETGYSLSSDELRVPESPPTTQTGWLSLFDGYEAIGTYTSTVTFGNSGGTNYIGLAAFNWQPSDVGVAFEAYTGVLPPDANYPCVYEVSPVFSSSGGPNEPVPIFMVVQGGTNGIAYSETVSEIGGIGPFTYSNPGGGLPTGLSLSGNIISGTPTINGTYNFNIEVVDSTGANNTVTYQITIVSPAASGASYSWGA